jgi:hypothetical protein
MIVSRSMGSGDDGYDCSYENDLLYDVVCI